MLDIHANYVSQPFEKHIDTLVSFDEQEYPLSVDSIIRNQLLMADIHDHDSDSAFFVCDLGDVERQLYQWKSLLPRVQPCFAIKCNPDLMVIKTLAAHGIGFDCASKAEIQTVLDFGVSPENIIYANPCKASSHIRYSAMKGVHTMTFDNADELYKIKQYNPNAKMVLRILTDDSKSICKFGVKFGASMAVVPKLLQVAKDLEIDVIGISFHVGSGCTDATSFSDAVILARKAFDIGAEYGFQFSLLDIGGGFPGNISNQDNDITFHEIAATLRPAIDEHFPMDVKIIAEPGRYFVAGAFTLCTNITSRRLIEKTNERPSFMYYINDGMYGSFNCITFDHAKHCIPRVLLKSGLYTYKQDMNVPEYDCSIWGPTCDSIDCITREASLPRMEVGDWLYFDCMGAYTNAAASAFNGFKRSAVIYTNTEPKC